MLRRDFTKLIAGAGAALWADPALVLAQAASAKASPRLYATQATLKNAPAFARDNLAGWAGIDVILATRNDLMLGANGAPTGFGKEFHNVLRGLRINADNFFKIPNIEAEKPKSRRPFEEGVAYNLINDKFFSYGLSRQNLSDKNTRNWDTAVIVAADKNMDPRKILARAAEIPPEFVNAQIRAEMMVNHVLAHEAAHMLLKKNGLLIPEIDGLYCAPDGRCHDDDGLYDSTRGRFVRKDEAFMPTIKAKGLHAVPAVEMQTAYAKISITNQMEYFCDQFAINQCLTIGMMQQEATEIRNARALGGMIKIDHITAPQLDIRGKELDAAALHALVLSARDPHMAWRTIHDKWEGYRNELKTLKDAPTTPVQVYAQITDMLDAGKFADSPLQQEIVTQFLQAGRELAPRFFEIQTMALDSRPGPIQDYNI